MWATEGLGALSAAVFAWGFLKEVTIIFITSTIIWYQVKQQGKNTVSLIKKKKKLDKIFTEHGLSHQNKTQILQQSVCPIRKLT